MKEPCNDRRRRVAVVGIGIKCPTGLRLDDAWLGTLSGVSFAHHITSFDAASLPVTFACELTGFDPGSYFNKAQRRRLDRVVQLGVAAASDAIEQAAHPETVPSRSAVVVGTGVGGLATIEAQSANVLNGLPLSIPPYSLPTLIPNATAAAISLQFQMTGPSRTCAGACASGAQAVADAVRLIRSGEIDFAVAGGAEAPITAFALHGFSRMGALSQRNDEPHLASRPFDAHRDGFVLGEGAGMLALEAYELAEKRDQTILGEVVGIGESSDAYHLASPRGDGAGAAAAIRSAISDANLKPREIVQISAHGSSTTSNDLAEARAIRMVFGDDSPPVTSIKGAMGHSLGAAGAVELIIALRSADTGVVPPTANHHEADPDIALDIVSGAPRQVPCGPVLSNSFAFGGHNIAIVVRQS